MTIYYAVHNRINKIFKSTNFDKISRYDLNNAFKIELRILQTDLEFNVSNKHENKFERGYVSCIGNKCLLKIATIHNSANIRFKSGYDIQEFSLDLPV